MLIYKAFYALFRCTSLPSWGGVRSGESAKTGDSFHSLQGHIIPILHNAFKSVLRLFYSVGLISYIDTIKPPYKANHKATKSK